MHIRPRKVAAVATLSSLFLVGCSGTTETEAASTADPSPSPTSSTPATPDSAFESPTPVPATEDGSLEEMYATVEQELADTPPDDLVEVCGGLELLGAEALVGMALGSAGDDAPDNVDSERLAGLFEDACARVPDSNDEQEDGEATSGGEPAEIGETQTVGDYEVTLVSFEADATDAVMAMNEFNEQPTNGAYATAEFEMTYVGDTEGDPGFDLSYVVVADARQVTDSDGTCTTDRLAYEIGTLETGGSGSFVECYDVDPATIERIFVEELISFDDDGRVTWHVS